MNNGFWTGSVANDINIARSVINPITDIGTTHNSLIGYNIIDDSSLGFADKIKTAIDVYEEDDPQRPALPVMVGSPHFESVMKISDPAIALTYIYPAKNFYEPCQDLDFMYTELRYRTQFVDPDKRLWMILQTHSTNQLSPQSTTALRPPTVEELRAQQWISVGEGADGIFWFIYSSQQGWTGIKDSPTYTTEITELSRRLSLMTDEILPAQKTDDEFTVTSEGEAYVSTLTNPDNGKKYVVVTNLSCEKAYVQISHTSNMGQLRELDTGRTQPVENPMVLEGGDGTIYEFIAEEARDVTITTPQTANLVLNPSFELYAAGNFTNWITRPAMQLENTIVHTGSNSVRVQGPQAANYGPQSVSVIPGRTYTLSFWSFLTDNIPNNNTGTRVPFTFPSGSFILNNMRRIASEEWEEYKVIYKVPENYSSLRVDLAWDIPSTQALYFDDITLCEGAGECTGTWPVVLAEPDSFDPIGEIESVPDRSTITGWAYELNLPDISQTVTFYLNGDISIGEEIGSTQTNQLRSDINEEYGIQKGSHGFSYEIEDEFQSQLSQAYTINAYVEDDETSEQVLVATFTEQAVPTATPTPTSTPVPSAPQPPSASSGSASNPSTTSSQCSNQKPGSQAPRLYGAIPTGQGTVQLYFTKAEVPFDHYSLQYGTKSGEYQFGMPKFGDPQKEMQSFEVEYLSPNTTYYFRVRGGNNCAPGEWSNELSASTFTRAGFVPSDFTADIVIDEVVLNEPDPQEDLSPDEQDTTDPQLDQTLINEVVFTVVNTSGEAMEDVTITIDGEKVKTNATGSAEFVNVTPGAKKVLVEHEGVTVEREVVLGANEESIERIELTITLDEDPLKPFFFGLGVATGLGIIGGGVFLWRRRLRA